MDGKQLGFNLAEQGAARAASKANREVPGWTDLAAEAFRAYALTHDEFTTEDVRMGSPGLPVTSNAQAWGVVARKAASEGICTRTDRVACAKMPHSHKRPLHIWKSNIVRGAA